MQSCIWKANVSKHCCGSLCRLPLTTQSCAVLYEKTKMKPRAEADITYMRGWTVIRNKIAINQKQK